MKIEPLDPVHVAADPAFPGGDETAYAEYKMKKGTGINMRWITKEEFEAIYPNTNELKLDAR